MWPATCEASLVCTSCPMPRPQAKMLAQEQTMMQDIQRARDSVKDAAGPGAAAAPLANVRVMAIAPLGHVAPSHWPRLSFWPRLPTPRCSAMPSTVQGRAGQVTARGAWRSPQWRLFLSVSLSRPCLLSLGSRFLLSKPKPAAESNLCFAGGDVRYAYVLSTPTPVPGQAMLPSQAATCAPKPSKDQASSAAKYVVTGVRDAGSRGRSRGRRGTPSTPSEVQGEHVATCLATRTPSRKDAGTLEGNSASHSGNRPAHNVAFDVSRSPPRVREMYQNIDRLFSDVQDGLDCSALQGMPRAQLLVECSGTGTVALHARMRTPRLPALRPATVCVRTEPAL